MEKTALVRARVQGPVQVLVPSEQTPQTTSTPKVQPKIYGLNF
jgi:hypothetical protein